MRASRITAFIFLTLTVILSGLVFSAPMPLDQRLIMTQILITSLTLTGAATVFLMNLKGFTRRLKLAYAFISGSLLLVVLGVWQYIALAIAGANDSLWVQWGGRDWPFVVAPVLAYIGVWIVAKLVGVQSVFINPWVALGGALGIGLASMLLIGSITELSNWSEKYNLLAEMFRAAMALWTAVLVYRARSVMSELYHRALSWFLWYFIITIFSGLSTILVLYLPSTHWYVFYNVGLSLYLLNGLAIIWTALAFARVANAEKIMPGGRPEHDRSESSIDVVVLVAGLASSPRAVEPIMNRVRVLTASIDAKAKLNEQQQGVVAKVYLELEEFLVMKESVRSYRAEGLREMIELRFKSSVDEPVFWKKILGTK